MDDAPDRGNPRAPELEDLLNLCAALHRENVRYVLIGGFAVILHGWVRATKDIDLLVDISPSNIQALKRAMSVLPDNAAALIDDDEVARYSVIRIADEIIVDLMHEACGIDYRAAVEGGVEKTAVEGVKIPLASKDLLIRTKQTVRESDAMDVSFLRNFVSSSWRWILPPLPGRGALRGWSPATFRLTVVNTRIRLSPVGSIGGRPHGADQRPPGQNPPLATAGAGGRRRGDRDCEKRSPDGEAGALSSGTAASRPAQRQDPDSA